MEKSENRCLERFLKTIAHALMSRYAETTVAQRWWRDGP